MSQYDFDLLTIGGGSGGVRASRWSAGLKARVAICEENRYGGTCVLRGCIPKKLMLEGAKLREHIQYFSSYGWSTEAPKLNWLTQKHLRDKELARLENIYENLLSKKGVQVLKGRGKIVAPHTVEVAGQQYRARFILIATGGTPSVLKIPGHKWAMTSNEVFELTKQPSSLLIMGSGYIGVEFASIFNSFGTKVSLVFRRDKILRGFDKELRAFLQAEMLKNGIEMLPHTVIEKISKKGEQMEVTLKSDKGRQIKTKDQVLLATGRKPNIENLGLESVGVKTNSQGEIEVNEYFESSVSGIYAIGDVANTPYQLTPVATEEAMFLAEHLFANSKKKLNYDFIPTAVFSQPPLATVGLTEKQAMDKNYDTTIYTSKFRPLKYTVTSLDKKTFMKMIVDTQTKRVLGIHIAGEDAPEIMQGMALALKMGAKKSDFDKTIGLHPSSAEELVTMREPTRHFVKTQK